MKNDIEEFVKGCTSCQENKINTHHQKPHLYPITTNPDMEPFEVRQKKPGTHTPYVSPNPRLGVDESWG